MFISFSNVIKKIFNIIFTLTFLFFISSDHSLASNHTLAVEELEISKEIDLEFSRIKIIDEAFKKAFYRLLSKILNSKYINKLKSLSDNSEVVTDKLPINFKWVGLIKLILPNSKIVHCIRDPKDTCISIFKNYFANPDLNFAYNLEDISEFYNLYNDLMKHWKNTLPKFVIDIKYEKIIQNPKQQIRSLLKACNLNWNDKCLKFYNNKRVIKTASDIQARKKIYKSSIDSWLNYKKYLEEVFKRLPN